MTQRKIFLLIRRRRKNQEILFLEKPGALLYLFFWGGGGREDRRGLNPKVRGSEPGKAKKNLVAPLRSFVSKNVSK